MCVCVCVLGGGGGGGGGHDVGFFSHQHILQRAFPVFLRKPIATCDFPGGGGMDPLNLPLSGSAHGTQDIRLKPTSKRQDQFTYIPHTNNME